MLVYVLVLGRVDLLRYQHAVPGIVGEDIMKLQVSDSRWFAKGDRVLVGDQEYEVTFVEDGSTLCVKPHKPQHPRFILWCTLGLFVSTLFLVGVLWRWGVL